MSEPEINFYLDQFGSIKCSVTNKGVLLGEDEQKLIVDSFAQLRDENSKLRELAKEMYCVIRENNSWWDCRCDETKAFYCQLRKLGIEVDE